MPQDAFVIGHVGEFNKVKNQGFLLEVERAIVRASITSFLCMWGTAISDAKYRPWQSIWGFQIRCALRGSETMSAIVCRHSMCSRFLRYMRDFRLSSVEAQTSGLPCLITNTIPSDCDLTSLIRRLPLDHHSWAKEIISLEGGVEFERKSNVSELASRGFRRRLLPQRICNAFTWIERVGRSKMKIGFHIVQLGGGGAERVLVLLANYFSAKGHKVYVIANKACADEYCIDSSIDKRYIDDELIAEDGPIIRNAKRIKFIRDLCRLEDIDCMISFMAEPNIRSIIACLGLRTKNIVSVRNEPAREYPGIKLTVARALFRLADCIALQTTQAVEAFKGLEKRATIIPNPVDESFYCVRADLDSARIVTAGRLEAQKNQELLIRAFAKICDEFPETTLDIFGTGALLEHLQRVAVECGVAPQVVFHGRTKTCRLSFPMRRFLF